MANGKRFLHLSVHELVDCLLRTGDIDDRVYNQETMQMGSKLHAAYQQKQGNEYLSEYPLAETFERKDGIIALQGRADGIIYRDGEMPIIDEIKSTVEKLEDFFLEQEQWHLGQALCYALMYLHEKGGKEIGIQLTYISQIDQRKMVKSYTYTLEQVEEKVYGYMDEYLDFHSFIYKHQQRRNETAKSLPFPYKHFRDGQHDLAKYCYGVAKHGGIFFAEAPTGIGKTMSTLFPFVKSFADGHTDRIFYLTAKNTGGLAAYDAMGELYEKGFEGFDSFLIAKEKMCFNPGHSCNPDDCPFAKGYYTKLKQTLLDVASSGKRFDRSTIVDTCMSNRICPFEFQLDLSLWSDVIIADYNYFFDPIVYLERYFDPMVDSSRDLILVDEAHNLVDRGRDMYSVTLYSNDLSAAKKLLKGKQYTALKRGITKVEKALLGLLPSNEDRLQLEIPPDDVEKAIDAMRRAEQKFQKETPEKLPLPFADFGRASNRYLKLVKEYFSSSSRVYATREGKGVALHILCLDASKYLEESMSKVKGVVLFSATLSPISYYMDSLTGKSNHPYLLLPSPFPKENFDLMLAPNVSVRYKDRAATYQEVANYLREFVAGKKGNYFLFFPSYDYLMSIAPYLDFGKAATFPQTRQMSEEDRASFLSHFPLNPGNTNVGLLILGGAFSEGIDMADDRLIGVAVIGIGLPQVGFENDLLKDYHQKRSGNGFDYAYKDPGMNKVMQAVGRLIRSETDRGAALLIDDRYMRNEYRDLFSRTWTSYDVALSPIDVRENLISFYKKN